MCLVDNFTHPPGAWATFQTPSKSGVKASIMCSVHSIMGYISIDLSMKKEQFVKEQDRYNQCIVHAAVTVTYKDTSAAKSNNFVVIIMHFHEHFPTPFKV